MVQKQLFLPQNRPLPLRKLCFEFPRLQLSVVVQVLKKGNINQGAIEQKYAGNFKEFSISQVV